MLGGFLTSNPGGFESFKLWTSHDPKPMDFHHHIFSSFSSLITSALFVVHSIFRQLDFAQLLEQDAQFVTGQLDILSFNALLGVCRQASRWEEAHRSNEKSCGKLWQAMASYGQLSDLFENRVLPMDHPHIHFLVVAYLIIIFQIFPSNNGNFGHPIDMGILLNAGCRILHDLKGHGLSPTVPSYKVWGFQRPSGIFQIQNMLNIKHSTSDLNIC
jgi:hypothetical protein